MSEQESTKHPASNDRVLEPEPQKRGPGWWVDRILLATVVLLFVTGYWRNVQSGLIRLVSGPPAIEEAGTARVQPGDWNWQLRNLNGEFIELGELRGKPMLVNLWATWCPPCRAELPSIQKLHNDYGDRVNFVLVSNENSAELIDWVDAKGYDLPFYRTAHPSPDVFSTTSIPATWIVDRDGSVRIEHRGAANWNSRAVRTLLDEMLAAQQ